MYNTFSIDLPVPSFVFHSSLLTAKSVNLVVAHDGFLFITATLNTQLLFKYFSIHTGWYQWTQRIAGYWGCLGKEPYSLIQAYYLAYGLIYNAVAVTGVDLTAARSSLPR